MSDQDQQTAPEVFGIGKLGKHSLIYGLGQMATKSVGFIMLPIYARLLTPADYGVIQLIAMTIEMATIFTAARLSAGVFYFYHNAPDERSRREILSTAGVLVAITYAVVVSVLCIGARGIATALFGAGEGFDTLVRISAVGMAFGGLFLVPVSIYQVQMRSLTFVSVNLYKLLFMVVLNLIFLIPFSMGVVGVLLSGAITNIAMGTVLTGRLIRYAGLRFKLDAARGLIRIGAPLIMMQGASFILTFGDRYFLNQAGDTTMVGLYGLAYQFGLLAATIGFMPFSRVWNPQSFAVAKRPDSNEVFARVFIYLNLLLVSLALGVALFAGDVIRVMATPPFHPAAIYVPVLSAAYVLQSWGSFLGIGVYIKKKTEYSAIANWVAAGVALAGYAVLIPRWLVWGAVFSTVASLATRAALVYLFSQRLWRVEYRWGPVVLLCSLGISIGAISFCLPKLSVVASVVTHTVLFAAFLLLAWILPILDDKERARLRQRLGQLRRNPLAA